MDIDSVDVLTRGKRHPSVPALLAVAMLIDINHFHTMSISVTVRPLPSSSAMDGAELTDNRSHSESTALNADHR